VAHVETKAPVLAGGVDRDVVHPTLEAVFSFGRTKKHLLVSRIVPKQDLKSLFFTWKQRRPQLIEVVTGDFRSLKDFYDEDVWQPDRVVWVTFAAT
jgi:hypothetical protein